MIVGMKYISRNILLSTLVGLLLCPVIAWAQPKDGFSTIRDEELERYLKSLSRPIFQAAGLHPENIRLIMVNHPSINAFVAGGQNLFIHTGLILATDDPDMLTGVIAHEAGHIAGGHLIRKTENMEQATTEAAVGYILGVGSMLIGAPPNAAAVLMSGGQHIAERNFLKFSRAHEEAADQAALAFLKKAKISPGGLMRLMEKLAKEQSLLTDDLNPYAVTHPLSPTRVSHIRNHMSQSPNVDFSITEEASTNHARMLAKLHAFLTPAEKGLKHYKDNTTLAGRYGQAIAYYRLPDLKKALEEIDSLITDYPNDPFFHELRGQMLYENGHIDKAILSYQNALDLLPDATLIRLGLATAQLATNDKALYTTSIQHLKRVLVEEPRNVSAWHQLAIAHGKRGDLGLSYLALAEEALLLHQEDNVRKYLALAQKNLPQPNDSTQRIELIKQQLNAKTS